MQDLSKSSNLKIRRFFVLSFSEIINTSNKDYMRLFLKMILDIEENAQGLLISSIFDFLIKIYSFIELKVFF